MGFFSFIFKSIFAGRGVSGATRQKILAEWRNVDVALRQGQPSQLRQAIISADKCLDSALRDIVAGNTMGERLKNAKNKFDWSFYQKVWEAHKVRNTLVHEAGYEPTASILIRSIEVLKKALFYLGVKL